MLFCVLKTYLFLPFFFLSHFFAALASSLQFIQEPTNHVARENQPTWWHCVASGNPIPSYTWYFNDQPIRIGQPNYDVMSNGTLHIYSVNANSVGTYQCQVQAGGEIIRSSQVELQLAGKLYSMNEDLASNTLYSKEKGLLSCLIRGY